MFFLGLPLTEKAFEPFLLAVVIFWNSPRMFGDELDCFFLDSKRCISEKNYD